MKVLFVCPYPIGRVASQRFRFEQYFALLEANNIICETAPFGVSDDGEAIVRAASRTFSKIKWLLNGLWSRAKLFRRLTEFDFIFIHREMAPIGPPLFEWLIAHFWRKKIIYDFDDAIWLTDKTDESTLDKIIRYRSKVGSICRWSHRISCGNRYLADYARRFNSNVLINPTTIETIKEHNPIDIKKQKNKNITIGWTGSYSTLKYLQGIVPVLALLQQKYPQITFTIIADEDPRLPLKNVVFRPWSLQTEITDLSTIDIGIMPLPNDPWTLGKGGFKALQYMAMRIPAVVSRVGVNSEIVTHGQEGFLCSTEDEWYYYLDELIRNEHLRIQMGKRGRAKVIAGYSAASNAANFLSLFQ